MILKCLLYRSTELVAVHGNDQVINTLMKTMGNRLFPSRAERNKEGHEMLFARMGTCGTGFTGSQGKSWSAVRDEECGHHGLSTR